MKTTIYILLIVLMTSNAFGLISDNFTQVEDPNIVEFAFAFQNSLEDTDIFFWMIASLGIIAAASVFTWSRDAVNSAMFGSFISLFVAFLTVLIVKDGQRLISWDSFSIFVTVTALLAIYKKVSDK